MALDDHIIDRTTPIPLYYQLIEIILEEIKNDNYLPGESIPTEKEIGEMFGLSRTTVRQAMNKLVQDQKLYRIKSKGTFVSRPKIVSDFIKRVETYNEQMIRLGMSPSTKLLEFKIIKPTVDVAEALHLDKNDKCIYLLRKRFADGDPCVYVKSFLSYDLCRSIIDHDLEKESLYEIMSKNRSSRIYRINRIVEAVLANEYDSQILEIEAGQAIQLFTTLGYNIDGVPVEYSFARYRGDFNKFEVELQYKP